MSATTTRTGPILAWTSKLRPAEFNPCSGGLSFLDPDWVACITATIEQRNLRVVYFAISSFPVVHGGEPGRTMFSAAQIRTGWSLLRFDRHRGSGCPLTPATPPCVRVRTRRFDWLR